jgi:hypothetical protein
MFTFIIAASLVLVVGLAQPGRPLQEDLRQSTYL